ncbi:MAG: hypothetical protein ACOY4D_09620 [Pseudomonadota bacterium]
MSLLTEILDRLSGVTVVREKLHATAERVEKLSDTLLDHEKRLIKLELSRHPPPKKLRKPG